MRRDQVAMGVDSTPPTNRVLSPVRRRWRAMGFIRLGPLPKTRTWQQVVDLVGVGPARPAVLPLMAFMGCEQAVLRSFGTDRRDIEDLYAFVAAGRLNLSGSISKRSPLEQADAALRHLVSKDGGVASVVVEPQGSEW